ncbi:hypothetical protein BD410DRAFT_792016 [Rickenella mellea]|uniref:Uncharacterized protein n=1 Tax=Rickenella mellea TaxID=50990 RepID=A0A4Y7PX36_9AGAM|nr:hypothetical protein BD410DRAFT_792016 [Rickenella mellea]
MTSQTLCTDHAYTRHLLALLPVVYPFILVVSDVCFSESQTPALTVDTDTMMARSISLPGCPAEEGTVVYDVFICRIFIVA